jgi:hypothetical protein
MGNDKPVCLLILDDSEEIKDNIDVEEEIYESIND